MVNVPDVLRAVAEGGYTPSEDGDQSTYRVLTTLASELEQPHWLRFKVRLLRRLGILQ